MKVSGLARIVNRTLLAITAIIHILLLAPAVARAGVQLTRPVALINEPISQTDLYGTRTDVHKGVDFSSLDFGESVYAIDAGTVVDLNEDYEDFCNPSPTCPNHGNYVLIQHSRQYYDRDEGQNSYVYSYYMHLRNGQVLVNLNQQVNAGDLIAQGDDTGNSSGDHLHLQIVLHPSPAREIEPVNTLESEQRSRNPELWLKPYSGTTGTVVGKVTDANGNSIGGITVTGLQKQAGWGYASSTTYNNADLNPDDILVENWATTDVTPGTYHITLSNGTDMGLHSVLAGQTTCVGLYPVWLPYIKTSGSWTSTIHVRNNSTSKRAQVITTYFSALGTATSQRTDFINANGSIAMTAPSNLIGSAMAVSSEDIAVVVELSYNGGAAGYNGLTPYGGPGSVGWEQAGSTLYVPLAKKSWYGRWSEIYVMNAGFQDTTVSVIYTDPTGATCTGSNVIVAPRARVELKPTSCPATNQYYAAKITNSNNQRLAAVILEGDNDPPQARPALYNAFSSTNTLMYEPQVKKNYYQHTTGITIQNTGTATANVTGKYCDMNGAAPCNFTYPTLPVGAPYAVVDPSGIPDNFLGSTRLDATNGQQLTAVMTESNITFGGDRRMMSNLLWNGTTKIILALWYDVYTATGADWRSGVNVRNAGTGLTTLTATWYYQSGAVAHTETATLINSDDAHNFYANAPDNFIHDVCTFYISLWCRDVPPERLYSGATLKVQR